MALDERGWTLRHLATLTGVAYATLRGIAYYDFPIDEPVAVALSDALGTSVETWGAGRPFEPMRPAMAGRDDQDDRA